jgi:hypothetical protein
MKPVKFWRDPFDGRWYQDTATGTYPVMFLMLTLLWLKVNKIPYEMPWS